MRIVKVGTRGSQLALAQTKGIIKVLTPYHQTVDFQIKIIETKGDLIQDVALEKIGDKGLFVKEIEEQLLNKSIDFAVHSLKDMPSLNPAGLIFSKTPKREDCRDVLILKPPYDHIDTLPVGAIIGTGSKRRKYQLLALRPDLRIVSIRGNIDTRIKKIETEGLHGVVLAAAGLKRIGYEDKITQYLPHETFIPAPGQGALGLQFREDDTFIGQMLNQLHHKPDHIETQAERAFMAGIGGTCHEPIGAKAYLNGDEIKITGLYGNEKGEYVTETKAGPITDAKKIGFDLGVRLRKVVQASDENR